MYADDWTRIVGNSYRPSSLIKAQSHDRLHVLKVPYVGALQKRAVHAGSERSGGAGWGKRDALIVKNAAEIRVRESEDCCT